MHVIEDALDQLYDGHCMLNTNADDSWRPVPANAWIERRHGKALVSAVRRGSTAERAGVRVGDELLALDDGPFDQLVAQRQPRFLVRADARGQEWALASAPAGRHDSPGVFHVRRAGRELRLTADAPPRARADVEGRRLPNDIRYIALAALLPRGVSALRLPA